MVRWRLAIQAPAMTLPQGQGRRVGNPAFNSSKEVRKWLLV